MVQSDAEPHVAVFDDAETLARMAAVRITVLARRSVAERGLFTIALSGGSTPRRVYLVGTHDAHRTRIAFAIGEAHRCAEEDLVIIFSGVMYDLGVFQPPR